MSDEKSNSLAAFEAWRLRMGTASYDPAVMCGFFAGWKEAQTRANALHVLAAELYGRLVQIDNGTCTVCGGHRFWTDAGSNGPMRPCENSLCPTREWEDVLGVKLAEWSDHA